MLKEQIVALIYAFCEQTEQNHITQEQALSDDVRGLRLFDAPLVGFASADDLLFQEFKHQEAIGPHFLAPKEWMADARTVISFFLPFSDEVKRSNVKDRRIPSEGWLHGRFEGQALIVALCRHITDAINENGHQGITPLLDDRYKTGQFTSNWSERHIAFACGLGTFGLSKGLITEKGMAGRLGSVITNLDIEPDNRKYQDLYEYCIMCGQCLVNCPADSISFTSGKDHESCAQYQNNLKKILPQPRYGCGKCQVGVACQSKNPKTYQFSSA